MKRNLHRYSTFQKARNLVARHFLLLMAFYVLKSKEFGRVASWLVVAAHLDPVIAA